MIRHAMDVIKQAVEHINQGQIPVLTMDQPLYTIGKKIQWHWPEVYGEDKFVIILGGLHIEMAVLKLIGNWLDDSGWVEALVQANVASAGTAESFLKASHVTRTRRAHQVTAASLYILLQRAYSQYTESVEPGLQPLSYDEWSCQRNHQVPQFRFWYTALHLELLLFAYIRSIRTANFPLYVDSMTALAPWFFSMDHTNYARYLPIHIRDMVNLQHIHPQISAEFNNGNFTVHKSRRAFSSIAIDQSHEQNNATVKNEGSAVGLTQNPDALRRWMVSGPELVRVTSEFEACIEGPRKGLNQETKHHEQKKNFQCKFVQNVQSFVDVIEEMGNPFLEETQDVLRIDTRDIAGAAVVETVRNAEAIGKQQFQDFSQKRLVDRTLTISEPIKKNKLPSFSNPSPREKSKASLQVASLKSDCSLFSRLYIACQSRNGDLNEFFQHENQACPPSLSQLGKLRLGTKSDLLHCLETYTEVTTDFPDTDVIILDGAVMVNILKAVGVKTFKNYAQKIFLPYIDCQLQRARRVDVVWDQYLPNSLKGQTREKRGKGMRRRVGASVNIPGNWFDFLRIGDNKTELFSFLAQRIAHVVTDKVLITTEGPGVVTTSNQDVSMLSPCDHEEADSRMILHLADAVQKGYERILLRTVDTDVVALAIAAVTKTNAKEVWIAFGTGKHFRYISGHAIANSLGPDKSLALPLFHAFTGCDTVSSFNTRGKKTAWEIWKTFGEVTPVFLALSEGPDEISDSNFKTLERFTILLYDRTSNAETIDEARQGLFTKKGRTMDTIPPTKGALEQHIKRATYQGGHCWGNAFKPIMELPSPEKWG